MPEIFEQAVRSKLRFESACGLLSVEDLWDLPLTSTKRANLDAIAVSLYRQLKEAETGASFVEDTPQVNARLQLQFDVVKHVIDVKKAERNAAQEEGERRERKEKILAILARKQDTALEQLSLEELQQMVASL